jgi:hypothetical protein
MGFIATVILSLRECCGWQGIRRWRKCRRRPIILASLLPHAQARRQSRHPGSGNLLRDSHNKKLSSCLRRRTPRSCLCFSDRPRSGPSTPLTARVRRLKCLRSYGSPGWRRCGPSTYAQTKSGANIRSRYLKPTAINGRPVETVTSNPSPAGPESARLPPTDPLPERASHRPARPCRRCPGAPTAPDPRIP